MKPVVWNLGTLQLRLSRVTGFSTIPQYEYWIHRKKRFASFPSPAGMSLPDSPWAEIMTS
jgi:hypothetical protein